MAKSDPADGWSEGISINFLDAKTMGFAKSSSHHTRSFAQRRSSIALERLAKPSKESKYPVGEQNQPVEEKQHEADRPQQENNDASGAPHRARSLVRLQLIPIGKRSPHQRRAILVFSKDLRAFVTSQVSLHSGKSLRCSHFSLFPRQVICPTGSVSEFLSSPLAKNILLLFFRNM
jgi:hypothetical protein